MRCGGCVCSCAQQLPCQNWETLENYALLSWTNSILAVSEACKESVIENRKLERTAGPDFFSPFLYCGVWPTDYCPLKFYLASSCVRSNSKVMLDFIWSFFKSCTTGLQLDIGFSSAWKHNCVGRLMFCRSSWTSCILRGCLLLQLILSNHMTWISLAVWRERAICQLIFLEIPKDKNLLTSTELLMKIPFLTGLGVALGSFLETC